MRAMQRLAGGVLVLALLVPALQASPRAAAGDDLPANPFFEHTWQRTDELVASGDVARTWVWGPGPFTPALGEAYDDSPGGTRLVQYFDKSRMEINDPDGDATEIWYVTTGLLARELITGRMQVGDNRWLDFDPAEVNIAGDPDDADGPTYASFSGHLDDSPADEGAPLDATIERDGTLDCCVPDDHGVVAATYVPETAHRVADVFWDYLTSEGRIVEQDRRTRGPLFANPFYATGFPIGEAYWALVRVAEVQQWVLVQPFERRVLTYTPDNAPGWEVEMGNVGLHYHYWRYGDDGDTQDPPGWGLPPYPMPPAPDGQQVDIPDLDAHYDLHLTTADVDTGRVVASEVIRIEAFNDAAPDVLYLQEVPAVYGYFTLDGLSVDGVDTAVETYEDGLILGVDLPDGAEAPLEIALDFTLDVGGYPNDFIGTVLDRGVLRLGYWFPVISDRHGYSETLDPSQSRSAGFDVTLDVDSDIVVAHSGDEIDTESLSDGRVRYELTADDVRDFALALSRNFVFDSVVDPRTGVEVQLYSLAATYDPNHVDTILAAGQDAIEQMSTLLGPYPYAQLSYVDVGPNMPGGLEFPTLIYITAGYSPLDRLIYHETAHQWLYGIIGNRTLLDGWIDEGGAEFFERGLPTGFTEVPEPPAGGYDYWLDSDYQELPLDPERQWYYSIYEQGARFYYDLLDAMGWDVFWRSFSAIYDDYAFEIVTPWEMLATFQEYSSADLRPIFDDYFRYAWIWDLLPPGG